jgi:hypothetical protein
MKVEIVDVRPIQAATAKGTLETRHLVYFRLDDGPTQSIEVKKATLTREDAIAAIQEHVKFRSGIIGEYEL